jgi:hypothetical protein
MPAIRRTRKKLVTAEGGTKGSAAAKSAAAKSAAAKSAAAKSAAAKSAAAIKTGRSRQKSIFDRAAFRVSGEVYNDLFRFNTALLRRGYTKESTSDARLALGHWVNKRVPVKVRKSPEGRHLYQTPYKHAWGFWERINLKEARRAQPALVLIGWIMEPFTYRDGREGHRKLYWYGVPANPPKKIQIDRTFDRD